jgi:hypothetical protein
MRNYILAVICLYSTLFISGCFEKDNAGKDETEGTVHAARYANFVSNRIVPDGTI